MTKFIRLLGVFMLFSYGASAQYGKTLRPSRSTERPAAERLTINPAALRAVPTGDNPFGVSGITFQPIENFGGVDANGQVVQVVRDENGAPIAWTGQTEASKIAASDNASAGSAALEYLISLQPDGVRNPATEFEVKTVQTDEQGNFHVRLSQVWNNIPVYGSELIAHSKNNAFKMLNGRLFATPNLNSTTPSLNEAAAINVVKNAIGPKHIKDTWSAMDLAAIGSQSPFQAALVIYYTGTQAHLCWHIVAHPTVMRREVYFIDANNGTVLNHYDHTCSIFGGKHQHDDEVVVGAVTANGVDLLGVNRSFGAWQAGSTIYMEDASQSMFNPSSQMPDEPIGAIVTLDAKNTSPANSGSFDYDYVKSGSVTFNNTTAVSAHWNSIKSYEYYKTKFNRNSIDGAGGNIIAFINVADDDGTSMENAFWNGAAMWYGNGGSTFKKLARGLDVGGHEMTHGVVEKTANLEYQGESGALNESFADIFGAMIDPGNWQIGEAVMQPNTHTCLRDLSNPNNGVPQSSPFWQPAHVNQQYTGNQDNGGVHINSGIVNKAFYLFATSAGVGNAKAEQVYYKALRDYLVKSSKFVDCRIAIIQAATDLYGTTVANAAAAAFTSVGIVGSAPSGNYLGQLSTNPGTSYIMCVSDSYASFDLASSNGTVLGSVYNSEDIASRPSISDNGSTAVFVNNSGHIILIDFVYSGTDINVQTTQLSTQPEWRSAAISKDGRFVAATTDFKDNRIYIFDLITGTSETFLLYNPTYSQGQSTGDVQYSDVMEFDHSGEYLMYDAYNKITNTQNQTIEYWDIGFVQFRANGNFTNGDNAYITKLFSGLPEKTDIGNPTFAKNSPYIIAFDYYSQLQNQVDILGANTETGDVNTIASDIGDFSWPNYDREDKNIIFHAPSFFGYDIYKQGLSSTKIQGQGNASQITGDHVWGVWYANGNRSLLVDVHDNAATTALALQAAPNPTSGYVQLRFTATAGGDSRVSLVNALGQIVLEQQYTTVAGSNILDVDMSRLPTGNYYLQVAAAGAVETVLISKR